MLKKCILLLSWMVIAIAMMSMHQLSPLTLQVPTVDSAIFLTCAKWMRDGVVMYRDIFDHKGIFIYIFDMLGLKVGGLTGVWVLCIIWTVVSTGFVFRICRLFSGWNTSALSSMIFLFMVIRTGTDNTVELVALPFITSSSWVMLRAIKECKRLKNVEIIWFAVSFCIVALLKPNITISIDLLALALVYQACKAGDYKAIAKYIGMAICGVLVVFTPVILYLVINDALSDFISTFWHFNLEYSNHMNVNNKWENFLRLLFIYTPSLFVWIFVVGVAVSEYRSKGFLYLIVFFLITAYVNAGLSGMRFGHYLVPVYPFAAIFIAKGIDIFNKNRYTRVTSYCACCLFVCYCLNNLYNEYNRNLTKRPSDEQMMSLAAYVDKEVPDNKTIAIYGIDAGLFVRTNRKSATKYIYQYIIFDLRESSKEEYKKAILNNKPSLILVKNSMQFPFKNILSIYSKVCVGFEGVDVYKLK